VDYTLHSVIAFTATGVHGQRIGLRRPYLRTGTADLPHPPIQSVVLPHEDWSNTRRAASRLKSLQTVMKQEPLREQS